MPSVLINTILTGNLVNLWNRLSFLSEVLFFQSRTQSRRPHCNQSDHDRSQSQGYDLFTSQSSARLFCRMFPNLDLPAVFLWCNWGCVFLARITQKMWRSKWQPIPVFLPGKSHGQRSLVGYSPWSRKRVGHDWATNHHHRKLGCPWCMISGSTMLISLLLAMPTLNIW